MNTELSQPPTSVRWALSSLSLCILLASLGISIASVALPELMSAFDATFADVQWIVLAYLLAITTVIISVGRLGDLVGRRRLLLAGITVFAAASTLCGLAPSLGVLIAARALQGVGAASMMTLAMAVVGETVPKERTGSAIGLLGTMSAIGTALGPTLGGLLISGFGWQAIFLIKVPLGAAALFLVLRFLPATPNGAPLRHIRFDYAGTLLLALSLAAYALAMTLGHGQFSTVNGLLLLAAAGGAVVFMRVEAKAVSPLVQPKIFADRALRSNLVTNALVSTVIMATLVVGPFYLSRSLGLDSAATGLVLSVGPLMAALTAFPAGRLVDRVGAPRMTLIGLAGITSGFTALAALPTAAGLAGYLAPLVVVTSSYALFQTANNTAVMSGVETDRRGLVSGMLNLSRNLGLISGASFMGTVFALASASSDFASAPPEAVAGGMRLTFAVAAALIVIALSTVAIAARTCHEIAKRSPATASVQEPISEP
ncbi:MFS transporter [Propionivibrio soli]|uniref:MFS transporter n=1 Tax=Propionivibrio soli TaxID=2976531 RepID=UPI0021E94C77|nr:MFS transporter [Propionivibrio soli]